MPVPGSDDVHTLTLEVLCVQIQDRTVICQRVLDELVADDFATLPLGVGQDNLCIVREVG